MNGQEFVAGLPHVREFGVAAVGGVHRDRDVGLDAGLPERVELLEAERPAALEAGHRRRADQHGTGAALQAPFEFFERAVDDGQGDHRGGEDAVLVVERPLLVHPLVERVDDVVGHLRVVLHALLDQAGQRREHQRVVDAELVHDLQPRARLAEGGDGLHRLAQDLAVALALRAVAEVVLLGARTGHHLERRVGDVLADVAADHDLGATADLHVVDDALAVVREELGQRFLRFVHVVVGVEHGEGKLARGHGDLLGKVWILCRR